MIVQEMLLIVVATYYTEIDICTYDTLKNKCPESLSHFI